VLQAEIKKARHFDVPGLIIDYWKFNSTNSLFPFEKTKSVSFRLWFLSSENVHAKRR
jgi:hypothetical protein